MARGSRSQRAWTAIGVVGLLAGACGTAANPLAHLTTERAVGQSLSNLLAQPGVQMQLSLGLSAAQLQQLATGSGDHIAPATANGVSRTTLVMSVHTLDGRTVGQDLGAPAGSASSVATDVAVQIGSDTPVELRGIGSRLFARFDVASAVADVGAPAADASRILSSLAAADTTVPGAAALGQGHWVSADLSTLIPPASATAPQQARSKKMLSDLRSALQNHASFANSGDHGGRTEYTISIAAQGFVRQIVSSVSGDLGGAGATDGQIASAVQALQPSIDRIPPSQRVTFELWVSGDKAQEIDVDLAQFAHSAPFPVVIKMIFGPAGPISTPAGATPLDLTKVAGLVHFGTSSISSPSGATATISSGGAQG